MDLRSLRYFVAVAEESHFGRAAARLHMTQPPLSRAIKQLETDLGAVLLERSPTGVRLTAAGRALLDEARSLLARSEQIRFRVTAAAGPATISMGTLADSAEEPGTLLAGAFRQRHPGVRVQVREADLTDPSAGLRTALVDVALTRAPFDDTGLEVHVLRRDPVGAVLRTDDVLADRESLRLADLADRRWFQFPEGTDEVWRAFWNADAPREGPVVRTIGECLQAVLWNGTVGLTPMVPFPMPESLTTVPLVDMPPSPLVVAWRTDSPLVRSFVQLATEVYQVQ